MNSWIAALVGLQLLVAVPASAEQPHTKIKVNDKFVSLQKEPVIVNSRTYLTVEDMGALLNAKVKVNSEVVILQVGKTELIFTKKGGVQNGAIMQNSNTYLPFRFIVEKLGHRVKWEEKTRMAQIIVQQSPDSFVVQTPDSLTQEEKDFIQGVKNEKGVHQQGNLYVIARGQSPNPGYGIKYVKHEISWERLIVYVELTKPQPGKMYPQVISYPYFVGKAYMPKYTTITFVDVNTGKPLFE